MGKEEFHWLCGVVQGRISAKLGHVHIPRVIFSNRRLQNKLLELMESLRVVKIS
jgi:hypothetical protein